MNAFDGFRIVVSSALTGGRSAIQQGRTIFVSPAMYDLMSHAEPDELERLLRAIRVVEIPELRESDLWSLPMTISP